MRRLLVLAAAMLLLAAAACGNDEPTTAAETTAPAATASDAMTAGGDCQDDTKATGNADLEMQDFQFAPPCLIITTGQGLRLHNEGQAEHNFSVEGFAGLDVDVEPGEENNTEATGLDVGTYTFFCKYHRDSKGMKGELRIKAA